MIGLRNKMATAVLAVAVVLTSFVPSQAIQMPAAPKVEKSSAVENVQYYYRRDYYRPYRRDYYRPGYRPGAYYRPGWYGGYRGYSYYRPGYRRYNGYWYPLAAFGAGAVIGGAIAQPRYVAPAPRMGSSHVAWCANRYRSYRAYDNTFQPYNGPRQQCYSPYR
ncbi:MULTISPECIES: BA14K family protein [Rhizobium]|uniref:Lectin-like protein BA14k n=1 Tax=Rhizobium bangladeshense TaxID=1138189 RepID=A0ABS7LDQ1_9HYPH|nr:MULTISPECIES: BA14K family protein [Rhizobium]MBX4865479.1 BA14K family protein [Rhizobium bangladeshense]MBX4875313.1 BA14K family protein [Rhizobium bangladeshense]MBX4882061.1 BA14K family protein [Rhizobium bangladeshense]MBX4892605.1 BA14K family protein [Rhizobium bangladeshense]MBX4896439.1 BA14K family protein [Rhizobium bangladeshense]